MSNLVTLQIPAVGDGFFAYLLREELLSPDLARTLFEMNDAVRACTHAVETYRVAETLHGREEIAQGPALADQRERRRNWLASQSAVCSARAEFAANAAILAAQEAPGSLAARWWDGSARAYHAAGTLLRVAQAEPETSPQKLAAAATYLEQVAAIVD